MIVRKELSYTLSLVAGNATRECNASGVWNNFTNYDGCKDIDIVLDESMQQTSYYSNLIYLVGYLLSLMALSIAITIFVWHRR